MLHVPSCSHWAVYKYVISGALLLNGIFWTLQLRYGVAVYHDRDIETIIACTLALMLLYWRYVVPGIINERLIDVVFILFRACMWQYE
jgi:hypothetical protein